MDIPGFSTERTEERWAPCYANMDKGISFFNGIHIETDSISDPRWDRVLPILEEEQVYMCRSMLWVLSRLDKGKSLILDVGTGSGVFAIWAAKEGFRVLAIDISSRALDIARQNTKANGVSISNNFDDLNKSENGSICFLLQEFNDSFSKEYSATFDLVFLAPPYNPTFPEITPALHAESGEDGQRCFVEQIKIVPSILKDEGYCIGNQMSPVVKGNIQALETITDSFNNACSVAFKRVIDEDISIEQFLKGQYAAFLEADLYREHVSEYIERVLSGLTNGNFSLIYYEVQKQENNRKQDPTEKRNLYQFNKDRWDRRIRLHRNIVEYASRSKDCSLVPSFFVDRFPNIEKLNKFTWNEKKENKKKFEASPFFKINEYLSLINGDVESGLDLLLIDSSPMFEKISGKHESLQQELMIWLRNQEKLDTDKYVSGWMTNTRCLQKSDTGIFLHPVFTGLAYENHNSCVANWSFMNREDFERIKTDGELTSVAKLFDKVAPDINAYKVGDEFENGFLTGALDALNVPRVTEYYQALQERLGIKGFNDQKDRIQLEKDLVECHRHFHYQIHKRFAVMNDKCSWSILIGLPISLNINKDKGSEISDKMVLPQSYRGGIWIYAMSRDGFSITKEKYLRDIARYSWLTFADIYFANQMTQEIDIAKKSVKKASSKAAMVAIMSRNVSHNIGSHVVSYWCNKLEDSLKSADSAYSEDQKLIKSSKELLRYIQYRQDFLAELSTSIPCTEVALDIRQDIFDPFISPNSDKYGEAAKSSGKGISALLDFLAYSEGIELHNRIRLDIEPSLNGKSCRVSIPSGLIGVHAVYSILENFIRNAAKHYEGNDSFKLQEWDIFLNAGKKQLYNQRLKPVNGLDQTRIVAAAGVEDISCLVSLLQCGTKEKRSAIEACYQGEICDVIFKIDVTEPSNYADKYLAVTLWDMREDSCSRKTVDAYRKYLPDYAQKVYSFSDDKGELIPGGWGIKEIVTSANFLRKNIPDMLVEYERDNSRNEPPLIEILCDDADSCNGGCSKDDDKYKGKLGIRFYLRKPKNLAVGCGTEIEADVFKIEAINEGEEVPHSMLLVHANEEEKYQNPGLPCRIMTPCSDNGPINDEQFMSLYREFILHKLCSGKKKDLPAPVNVGIINNTVIGDPDWYAANEELLFVSHLNASTVFGKFEHFYKTSESAPYIQPLSAGYSTSAKINGISSLTEPLIKKLLCFELVESALTKIVIVDERIGDWAGKEFIKGQNGIKIRDILLKIGILAIDVDLENITCEELYYKLGDGNETDISMFDEKTKPHFFVIHQGILDKLNKKEQNSDTALMNSVMSCWKVIDSGRGAPEPEKMERYPDARFIQISALQRLLENYDKHGLAQMLFSSRRPKS